MNRKLFPIPIRTGWIAVAAVMLAVTTWGAQTNFVGFAKVERFDGVNSLAALMASPKYINNTPDSVKFISGGNYNLEPDSLDNFGARITGYITPTEEADYVFFISADDNASFYLSTDATPANLKLIAADIGWQNARTWTGPGGVDNGQNPPYRRGTRAVGDPPFENRSDMFRTSPQNAILDTATPRWPTVDSASNAVIHLLANQKYAFRVLYNDGSGGGHTEFTWKKATDEDPINGTAGTELPAEVMSVDYSDTLSFKTQPTNTAALEGQLVTFRSEANGFPGGVTYQWQENSVDIPNETGLNYVIPSATIAANNGKKYKVIITSTLLGSTLSSTEATLSVSTDNVGPSMTKIRTSDSFRSAKITFSEPVSNEAIDQANYVVTGGPGNAGLTVEGVSFVIVADVATEDPANPANPLNRQAVILLTSQQAVGATYTLTVNNVKDMAGNAISPKTKQMFANVFQAGILNYKRWEGGNSIPTLINDPNRLENPTVSDIRPVMATGGTANTYVAGTYVDRVDGFFVPTVTGDYVFLMSADNNGYTYLSTDADPANRKMIAADVGWQNTAEWTGPGGDATKRRGDTTGGGPFENRSDQFLTSARAASGAGLPGGAVTEDGVDPEPWPNVDANGNALIHLTNGVRYAFQLWHTEGDSGRAEVNYKLVTEADPANGSATRINSTLIGANVDPTSLAPIITTQPTNVNFTVGGTVAFTVAANSAVPLSYQWSKNGLALTGQTNATLTINNATAADIGSYIVAVSNENGSVSSARVAAMTTVTAPGLTFQEDSNGQTVIEAEHYFSARTATDGHIWLPISGRADASGAKYMTLLPDAGVNLGNAGYATSARLDFKIAFNRAGTHYLWIRGGDPFNDGAGDSVHAGIDDTVLAPGTQITGAPTFTTAAWNWVGANNAGTRVSVEVPDIATHTVSLWMREDGFLADKIILTTDSTFTPTGQGPAESAQVSNGPLLSVTRNGASVTLTFTGTLVSSATVNGTYAPVAGATGGSYTIPAGQVTQFYQAKQ